MVTSAATLIAQSIDQRVNDGALGEGSDLNPGVGLVIILAVVAVIVVDSQSEELLGTFALRDEGAALLLKAQSDISFSGFEAQRMQVIPPSFLLTNSW